MNPCHVTSKQTTFLSLLCMGLYVIAFDLFIAILYHFNLLEPWMSWILVPIGIGSAVLLGRWVGGRWPWYTEENPMERYCEDFE